MTRYASGRYHRASGTRNAFAAWGADLVAAGYPEPVVNSGDREEELQEQIFLDAYVPSSGPRDVGPFNDRRYWPGHGYWKRVKGNATIAAPGASNHEKRRASDLAYPYDRDTPAHRAGQRLAKRHNITCEGMGFREWWHWTFWGALGAIDGPSGSATTPARPDQSKEDDMPESMAATVDGVPSWCWLNWGFGTVYAVHTQAEADWIGKYMGSVDHDWFQNPIGGDLYKNKLALFGIMCPDVKVEGASLTDTDLARIKAMLAAGPRAALTGVEG